MPIELYAATIAPNLDGTERLWLGDTGAPYYLTLNRLVYKNTAGNYFLTGPLNIDSGTGGALILGDVAGSPFRIDFTDASEEAVFSGPTTLRTQVDGGSIANSGGSTTHFSWTSTGLTGVFKGGTGGPTLGLRIWDPDNSHTLRIVPDSNLTANRELIITTGNADRTINISAGSPTFSAFGLTLIDDADASAARTTLGLGTIATQAASAVAITGGSGAFTTGLGLTINQNATTTFAVTNTDATNANSRAQVTIQAGTVAGRMLALATSSMVFGTTSAHDFILQRNSSNIATVGASGVAVTGFVTATTYLKSTAKTVATLTAAATAGAGARDFVTDANATTFASVVAGGGANGVPVYSDGTNWRIG